MHSVETISRATPMIAGVTLAQLHALADRYTAPSPTQPPRPTGEDLAKRVRAYLATIPPAVSGQRGHDRTFYTAGRLVRGFDLKPDEAFAYLAEWNAKCNPPWSDVELRHKLADAARQPGPRGFLLTRDLAPGRQVDPTARFRNFVWAEVADGETTRNVPCGRPGVDLLDSLTSYTGGWPRRVGGLLFARGAANQLVWMKSQSELFAWIDSQYGGDGRSGCEWAAGRDCLTREQFFVYCQQNAEEWDHVELYPHEPRIPGHYYFHPEPTGGDGSALTDLIRRFYPSTPEDEDLIRLFFLTLLWGGAPSQRPIFLFESDSASQEGGRGAGKSTVPFLGSRLVGGVLMISPREQIRDVHTRLLSPDGLTRRVALIDNLKSMRYSDSDLEGLVTSPVISGRQMYVGEGQRPNSLLWVVTSNKPSLSKDLAQRSVIVRVTTPTYGPEWQSEMTAHIDQHRWAIIGDCLAELRRPAPLPGGFVYTRWAAWERDVLAKAPQPAELARLIAQRRAQIDDDDDLAAEVADAVRAVLRKKGFDPETDCVLIPSPVLFEEVVKKFAGSQVTRSHGLKWLHTIGVPGLCKHDASLPYRGAIWRPADISDTERLLKWGDRFGTDGLWE